MKLTRVTFTGIDKWTDLQRLSSLSQKYPYAEFGLLVSKDWKENGPRFPDPAIIWEIAKCWSHQPIPLSCHLCGQLAMQAAHGDFSFVESLTAKELFSIFERIQLNVKADDLLDVLRRLPDTGKEIIVKMKSTAICEKFLQGGSPKGMSYLLDASGGRGIGTTIEILNAPGIHVGYAGGIGPENIEEKLRFLLDYPTDDEFWIDMETRVRSEDKFDLDKVEQVLIVCDSLIKNYQ